MRAFGAIWPCVSLIVNCVSEYRKLDVYHESRSLARDLYRVTSALPLYLRWRLGGQLDKAAESIGANLAEVLVAGTLATATVSSFAMRTSPTAPHAKWSTAFRACVNPGETLKPLNPRNPETVKP